MLYSRTVRTSPLYAASFTSCGQAYSFRLRKPRFRLALVQILLTCVFHRNSFVIVTPKVLDTFDIFEDRSLSPEYMKNGRLITNFRFADDIVVNAEEEEETGVLVDRLDIATTRYKMEICPDKTKVVTYNPNGFQKEIKIKGQRLEEVENFKFFGAIISNEGSKLEILSRIAQTTAALSVLKIIWRDKNISLASKVKLMRTLILSTFLYACESWTLTAEIERRIQALEMRCYRRPQNISYISYKDHVTNEEVRNRIQNAIGVHDDLLTMVKKKTLRWYGHNSRSSSLSKSRLQGTVKGARMRWRQKKRWEDNIKEWTELGFGDSLRAAKDRKGWKGIVTTSSLVPRRPPMLRDLDEMRDEIDLCDPFPCYLHHIAFDRLESYTTFLCQASQLIYIFLKFQCVLNFAVTNTVIRKETYFNINVFWDIVNVQRKQ